MSCPQLAQDAGGVPQTPKQRCPTHSTCDQSWGEISTIAPSPRPREVSEIGGRIINPSDMPSSLEPTGSHPTSACKFPEKPMAAEGPGSFSSSDPIMPGATEGCRVFEEECVHQLVIRMCFYSGCVFEGFGGGRCLFCKLSEEISKEK